MKEVFFVSGENRLSAENALRKDEAINRGSITVKEASTLGINKSGFYIIIDCSEDSIKKATELLKNMAEKAENKEDVLKKVEDQEDSAAQGLGNILGV
jgi:hypothetical protein